MIGNIAVMKVLYFVCGLGWGIAIGQYIAGAQHTGDLFWLFRSRE